MYIFLVCTYNTCYVYLYNMYLCIKFNLFTLTNLITHVFTLHRYKTYGIIDKRKSVVQICKFSRKKKTFKLIKIENLTNFMNGEMQLRIWNCRDMFYKLILCVEKPGLFILVQEGSV